MCTFANEITSSLILHNLLCILFFLSHVFYLLELFLLLFVFSAVFVATNKNKISTFLVFVLVVIIIIQNNRKWGTKNNSMTEEGKTLLPCSLIIFLLLHCAPYWSCYCTLQECYHCTWNVVSRTIFLEIMKTVEEFT